MEVYLGIFLLLCICDNVLAHDFPSSLRFLQIIWRHGDRAPDALYPNDPNPVASWEEGLGKLTKLGRRQHYILGKYLRSSYDGFVTSSPNEVQVNSTDFDRCIRSAEVNLAAFYKPTEEWKFDESVDYQPIPVYYLPRDVNKFLSVESICAKATEEMDRLVHSSNGRAFNEKHKVMYEYYTNYSGHPVTNWTSAWDLYDVLSIEKKYNLTIPSWVDGFWDELEEVANQAIYKMYSSFDIYRLRAGPLAGKLIENMENKIKGKIPNLKVQTFSAHDDTIAILLAMLDLFNMKIPPYCAAIIVELHELSEGDYSVRLLYQNSTNVEIKIDTPHILQLHGCSEFCPLDIVKMIVRPFIPYDWDKECKN